VSTDNFEEVRSAGKAKRVRAPKPVVDAPVIVPIKADIAAVTLVEPEALELVASPEPVLESIDVNPTPTQPAAAQASEQPHEETIMATTAETVTATNTAAGTKIFADMNDRTKGAMEQGSKMFNEMNGFTKGNVEALVESGRIAIRGMEQMTREATEFARRSFETATANARAMAAVKSPTELMKLQADQTRAAFDQAVAQTSHTTEAMLKLAGEIAQPISNRVAVMADKIKTAA
jgi:phasin family protein